ncbi:BglII/BstYI family type II restriction endonuclease [Draconibacterium sediminis]|uniref:BglII/BstYI family type II restriction endonuclease n=1 Tax=Draconibacterium sediminis TaxID=1544798 RepID=UPI0026F19B13|nr:BglII/BstYI family type II restriction endonuclease [Draconibacterium sediminis]
MAIANLPQNITNVYEVHEYRHAIAILQSDFPNEYQDLINVLQSFKLKKSAILTPGGRKSPISAHLDSYLYVRGWKEHNFDTKISIDNVEKYTPTHKIDCYKNRIALDVEWNNKDPFYDRDLNNFRLLYERDAISVAIIITRCSELQPIFNTLGKGSSYGASTTHMSKLLPRIEGGAGGGCPILVFGISPNLYDPNA